MDEETIDRILKDYGLTQSEMEVYVFLAKHGLLKSREVARQIKKDKAQVLRILKNLQTKGIVEPTLETPQRFSAVPFERVLDAFVKTKREEAAVIESAKDDLLLYWKKISKTKLEIPVDKFIVIEGSHRVYSKILTMVDETKKQISVTSSQQGLLHADRFGIFGAVAKHPHKPDLQFRLLTEIPNQLTSAMKAVMQKVQQSGVTLRERNLVGVRLSPRMVIRDEEEIMLFFTPRNDSGVENLDETCLWTNCKDLVRSFAAVFEDLWNSSVEFQEKTVQIEKEIAFSTPVSYLASEKARKKYDELLISAKEEIIFTTSSTGLLDFSKNKTQLKTWVDNGLSLQLMAPIIGDNFSAARQLAEICPVKHIPEGYLQTALIDKTHLFYFNEDQTLYINDASHVSKMKAMLDEVWKNARPPSAVTLESIINPPAPPFELSPSKIHHIALVRTSISLEEHIAGMITERDVINKIINAKRIIAKDPRRDINVEYGSSAHALIHPLDFFNLPDMMIHVWHADKQSSFGAEDWVVVSLWLQTSTGYRYVPVVHVTDNSEAAEFRKGVYAFTPAGENSQLVSKDQFQVRVQGNTLFAGWTIPIKLFPPQYTLPPSSILFEGYGDVKTGITKTRAPSGRTQVQEFNRLEAFVTYFHPFSKYSGPGTDALFNREIVLTAYPPAKEQ